MLASTIAWKKGMYVREKESAMGHNNQQELKFWLISSIV